MSMIATQQDTIAAIATPLGTGGVGIIRISGSASWKVAQTLIPSAQKLEPGEVKLGWLIDPQDKQAVDQVLILPFKAPHSYTGQDCIEIHCHGGLRLVQTVLQLCLDYGARSAEPGEFSKRAVLNHKMDATQAESVLDLIHAEGEQLIKLAAHNLHHQHWSRRITEAMEHIAEIQAEITASVDFPDEVEEPERTVLLLALDALIKPLENDYEQSDRCRYIRDGFELALVGLPNAGKSSLFNRLLSQDRAIVTDIAGTTRDILREKISIKGIPLILVDTAGIRDTEDIIEKLGVARSQESLQRSTGWIYLVDGTKGLSVEDWEILKPLNPNKGLLIWNKADHEDYLTPEVLKDLPCIPLSCETGEGVSELNNWLEAQITSYLPDTQLSILLSARQMSTLKDVLANLKEAQAVLRDPYLPIDIATVPLTDGLLQIQALLGLDTTETMLDSLFSQFCVGK
jgi:tRNA modification GTPase